MSRVLITTAPLPGHLDWGGLLETAVCLVGSGHEVLWATGAAVRPFIENAGLDHHDIPVALRLPPPDAPLRETRDFTEFYVNEIGDTLDVWLTVEDVSAAVDAHIGLIQSWHPDVVLADPLVVAGAVAAEATGTRLASCGYPGPFATVRRIRETVRLIEELYARMDAVRAHAGLPGAARVDEPPIFFIAPELHLVYFTPDWFARYNPMPSPGAEYVGGAASPPRGEPPSWMDELPAGRPLVVITRSTVYGPPRSDLPELVAAVADAGGYALVAGNAGDSIDPAAGRVEPWVPFDHIFPRGAAVIHHGGMGTTHAAIRHGVPQLVTPAVVDQFLHADRVAAHDAGIAIRAVNLTRDKARAAITRLLHDPQLQNGARALRERFAVLGGPRRAAELLAQRSLLKM
jgi:L-2-deoxyfucosyltransferase